MLNRKRNDTSQEEHLKNSNFITDSVIGLADGFTVPFALTAGLGAAVSTNDIIITRVLQKL